MTNLKRQHGFTLVEMAIVLVIIGLILGAVTKGKDLIQSAKNKRFYSFIQQWDIANMSYYDRTGKTLYRLNSWQWNIRRTTLSSTLQTALESVGLTVPGSNTEQANQFRIPGMQGSSTASLYFYRDSTLGEAIAIADINSCDVYVAIDVLVDGVADGEKGSFINYQNSSKKAWPENLKYTDCSGYTPLYLLDRVAH